MPPRGPSGARQRLAALRIPMRPRELRITGSFGVAQCRDEMQDSEELVNLADQALLCAKRMGRDRVVRYSSVVDAAEPRLQPSDQQDGIFQDILARDVMSPLAACLRETADHRRGRPILAPLGHPLFARPRRRRRAGRLPLRKGPHGRHGLARLLATSRCIP